MALLQGEPARPSTCRQSPSAVCICVVVVVVGDVSGGLATPMPPKSLCSDKQRLQGLSKASNTRLAQGAFAAKFWNLC